MASSSLSPIWFPPSSDIKGQKLALWSLGVALNCIVHSIRSNNKNWLSISDLRNKVRIINEHNQKLRKIFREELEGGKGIKEESWEWEAVLVAKRVVQTRYRTLGEVRCRLKEQLEKYFELARAQETGSGDLHELAEEFTAITKPETVEEEEEEEEEGEGQNPFVLPFRLRSLGQHHLYHTDGQVMTTRKMRLYDITGFRKDGSAIFG